MILKKIILYTIALLFITSCSVEKRRYTKGYHVEWNKNITKRKTTTSTKQVLVANNLKETSTTDVAKDIEATPLDNSLTTIHSTQTKEEQIILEQKNYGKKLTSETIIVHLKENSTLINGITETKNKTNKIIKTKTNNNINDSSDFFQGLLIVLLVLALIIGLIGVLSVSAQESAIYIIAAVIFIALMLFLSWLGLGDAAFFLLDVLSIFLM
jgi:hypothetical protein